MVSDKTFRRFYPDNSKSGTIKFYNWVWKYLDKSATVLNLGAGPTSGDSIKSFKGKVNKVIGADIDEVVLNNTDLDEAYIINNSRLPFEDNTFDLVLSDYVLEHIEKPVEFLLEVKRVLKPGKSFFFRTPNSKHYVTLISRFTPHHFHLLIANKVRGLSIEDHDPYKTFYKMNSKKVLNNLAEKTGFKDYELLLVEAEPSYFMFNSVFFLFGVGYERLVNKFDVFSFLRVNIFGQFVK
jgi:ubiquinone/menaquinone biosynthesis C-methylase UbiE